MTDYETFDIAARKRAANGGRYSALRDLPLGAHIHYAAADFNPKSIRASISTINKALAPLHFSVISVRDDDPKGAGVRVLRDDKPMRTRPTQASA